MAKSKAAGSSAVLETPMLERVLVKVAPAWAAARADARLRIERSNAATTLVRSYQRGYDAAAYSRRTQGWRPTNASGSSAMMNIDQLRARARDLARNNEWMAKGLAVIEDDVIGSGFAVKFSHRDGGIAKEATERWRAWADTLQVDPEGLVDFSGLLGLATRGMAEGGDMFIRRRWRKAEDGLAVPLQFQLLEGDHLDSTKEGNLSGGGRIVQGVEHDALGRRVAYWLFREHPGDANPATRESVRVPSTEVLHLFRVERKGAVRGIPWGTPCLLALRDIAEFADANLLRQKLSNMFVGVVKLQGDVAPFAPQAEGPATGRGSEPIEEWTPGMMQYLANGEEMQWNAPPAPGVDHADFMRVSLLQVAAGLQIPYEALTGDLRNTSFSSGRLGWLQWQRRIEAYRWRIIVPRVCAPAARWFLEALAVEDGRMLEVAATWDPPHREMIDPVAEVNSLEKAIRAGLLTRPAAVRSLGLDPEAMLEETAKDQAAQKAAGVMFTTNPENDLGRKPEGQPGRKPGEAANKGT
jgi:lambda family phage portal protein